MARKLHLKKRKEKEDDSENIQDLRCWDNGRGRLICVNTEPSDSARKDRVFNCRRVGLEVVLTDKRPLRGRG